MAIWAVTRPIRNDEVPTDGLMFCHMRRDAETAALNMLTSFKYMNEHWAQDYEDKPVCILKIDTPKDNIDLVNMINFIIGNPRPEGAWAKVVRTMPVVFKGEDDAE